MGVRFTLWAVDPERLLDALTHDEASNARQDSLHLQCALRRASRSADARGIVQLILDGHRRWWVGSFVESLRRSPWLLSKNDAEHTEDLLSGMLRGLDCGTAIRDASPSASRFSFPIAPRSEADLRLAVLSSSDFEFLRLVFDERLRDDGRRFGRPSGTVGIGPDSDDAWDAWVRQVIREIATTPLEVPNPALLSFLG